MQQSYIWTIYRLHFYTYSSSTMPRLQTTDLRSVYNCAMYQKPRPDKPLDKTLNTHDICATCIYSCMIITCDKCSSFDRKDNLREYAVNEWFKNSFFCFKKFLILHHFPSFHLSFHKRRCDQRLRADSTRTWMIVLFPYYYYYYYQLFSS